MLFFRMKPRRLFPLIPLLLCLFLIFRASRPKGVVREGQAGPVVPEAGAPVASRPPLPPAAPAASAVSPAGAVAENRAAEAPGPVTPPAATGTEQALQRIESAVVTYDAASLPVIAPYLTHADPELRLAAREGLLQMGLSEAVPLLREAAGKLKDPREAILLLDAADFLELPSVSSTAGKKRRAHPVPPPATQAAEIPGRR